jgi:magnesium chelatase accessory protein
MASVLSHVMPLTGVVDKLLDSTNSALTESQKENYRLIFKNSEHIYGSMNFMAASNIPQLLQTSSLLKSKMTYVLTADDPWVKKSALMPNPLFPA